MNQALATFKDNLPTRKDETWKYTNIKFFFEDDFKAQDIGHTSLIENTDSFELRINNNVLKNLSNDYLTVEISDSKNEKLLSGNIQKDKAYNFITQSVSKELNITIEKDLKKPLYIIHEASNENNLIETVLNISSKTQKLEIVEVFKSTDDSKCIISNLTKVSLEKNQIINHIIKQNLNNKSMLLNNTVSKVKADSHYSNVNIHTGSRLTRHNVHSEINEAGATSDIHGLYVLNDQAHVDTNSFIHHNAPHTYSNQLYKTVLDDSSRGVFTGLIRVEKDSQKVDSKQLNKNLLLTTKAHANSRPQLEIYADDVKCAHGSTTGQIRDEELFYFQSRGVNAQKARKILAKAFINEVIFKIDNLDIRKQILEDIQDD